MSTSNHIDKLGAALALLDEAHGFAALSPAGRDNITEAAEMIPDIVDQAYRSGFVDGERHAQEADEHEHKRNSSFVPVQNSGTVVHRLVQLLYRLLRDHPEIDIGAHWAQTTDLPAVYSLPALEAKARELCADIAPPTEPAAVTDTEVEAASKAIYEHKPYLNHSGKSHMAWSVFRRELSNEYEQLKVAVRIGLEAAARARAALSDGGRADAER